jgi:hypothetical protein
MAEYCNINCTSICSALSQHSAFNNSYRTETDGSSSLCERWRICDMHKKRGRDSAHNIMRNEKKRNPVRFGSGDSAELKITNVILSKLL